MRRYLRPTLSQQEYMVTAELNQLLKKKRIVSATELTKLDADWSTLKTPVPWEEFLLEKKAVTEDQLLKVKSEEFGVPVVDLTDKELTEDILNLVPEPIARRHQVISFAKAKDELSLAMTDPSDLQTKEFIKKKTGLEIKVFLIGKSSLDHGLAKYHTNLEGEIKHMVAEGKPDAATAGEMTDELKKMAQEIPIIRVVDTLLEYAVIEKASDIHIEPQETAVVVRYRIDGVLHDVMTLPKAIQAALVARIKVLANLKIDEHRIPQDGTFTISVDGQAIDLRIAISPVVWGEQVVIRLLDKTGTTLELEAMGYTGRSLRLIRQALKQPYGMILTSGPTGSGKSTTMYAMIQEIKSEAINIVTLEDPVEYQMAGINQVQVNTAAGLTFATGLRSFLRQDPNIILVGEIRDKETAQLAIQAALTGHLVFSTLHTNNAVGAIPRLRNMGIEEFLLSASINLIMAQRLIRKLCNDCKKETKVSSILQKEIDDTIKVVPKEYLEGIDTAHVKTYEAVGCEKCGNIGYKGRMGIFEVLPMFTELQDIIFGKLPSYKIYEAAAKLGMITMKQDGVLKVLRGETTMEEIARVTTE
mgnify:CR=1 FL=1